MLTDTSKKYLITGCTDAKVNDGVLTIELPKRTPEDKEKAAKVIEVK